MSHRSVFDAQQEIADLKRRLHEIEKRLPLAQPEPYIVPINTQPKGCVCPPGAEFGCQSSGCPRKGINYWPITCGGSATGQR